MDLVRVGVRVRPWITENVKNRVRVTVSIRICVNEETET